MAKIEFMAPNQATFTENGLTYFQSYGSIIAKKENGVVTLMKNIGIIPKPLQSIEINSSEKQKVIL